MDSIKTIENINFTEVWKFRFISLSNGTRDGKFTGASPDNFHNLCIDTLTINTTIPMGTFF